MGPLNRVSQYVTESLSSIKQNLLEVSEKVKNFSFPTLGDVKNAISKHTESPETTIAKGYAKLFILQEAKEGIESKKTLQGDKLASFEEKLSKSSPQLQALVNDGDLETINKGISELRKELAALKQN